MSARLSRDEIQLALDKILKKYDDYIYRYFKPPGLKSAFEERYFTALRKGMDMESFLSAEIGAIEELLGKEEDRINAQQAQGATEESFGDKVLRQLSQKIEKYPDIRIHKDANPEIRRFLGALNELHNVYMPLLQESLVNTSYGYNSSIMTNLESRLHWLSVVDQDGVSHSLSRYLTLFNTFPRDYAAIDHEEKAFIMEAAFFLHDLSDIISEVQSEYNPLTKGEKDRLARVGTYIDGIIEDFRIKDLKRKNF
jgi:hypothetical protein